MSGFLITEENPNGYKLEDILKVIRKEIIQRANKITGDARPEAAVVLENNIKILGLLTETIALAEDSTKVLDKSFGPHETGKPRIGVA